MGFSWSVRDEGRGVGSEALHHDARVYPAAVRLRRDGRRHRGGGGLAPLHCLRHCQRGDARARPLHRDRGRFPDFNVRRISGPGRGANRRLRRHPRRDRGAVRGRRVDRRDADGRIPPGGHGPAQTRRRDQVHPVSRHHRVHGRDRPDHLLPAGQGPFGPPDRDGAGRVLRQVGELCHPLWID